MDSATTAYLHSDNLSNSSASTPPSTASPRTDFSASAEEFAMIYNQSPPQSTTAGFPHLAARASFDNSHHAPVSDKPYPFAFAPPHQQDQTMSMDVQPPPQQQQHEATASQQYWSAASSSTESLHSQGASFLSDLQHAQMKLDRLQHEASPELYYSQPAPPQQLGGQPMPQPWNYTPEAELPDQMDPRVAAAAAAQQGMTYGAPDPGHMLRSQTSYSSFASEHAMQMDYSSDSDGNIYATASTAGMPIATDPSALHDGRLMTYRSGSEAGYDVKEERRSPELVGYSRPSSSASHHSVQQLIFRPQMMQVMHTDDAASKETQFLRRKCHNCLTTEPPSWRRSTLTPGKIVCNKCGLYERTHGRTRPHRFDELRCGTKVRKTTKIVSVISRDTSPNTAARMRAMGSVRPEEAMDRRGSMESEASDASRSVSRAGSIYNSPNMGHSYTADSPIRVPQVPMKSATLPTTQAYEASIRSLPSPSDPYAYQRRNSAPTYGGGSGLSTPDGRRHSAVVPMPGIPEATGWQTVPVSELTASPSRKRN